MSPLDFIKTPKVDNVKLVDHTSNLRAGVNGTLHLTTTHLIFVDPNGAKETWILYSHIAEAEKLPITARGSSIKIKTKTFRNVTFIILRERECTDVFETITQLSNPTKYEDLYAFHYNPKGNELTQVAGWALYDATVEFGRQEVPAELWARSKLNLEYKLCKTYPGTLYLPASVNDDIITACAKFRSKNRLPVLSYFNKATQTSICRCAQPLTGFNTRCTEDEQMLQALIKSTPNATKMYIVDTRPKINAMANRAAGKGYENMAHYENIDFKFIGIENIHVMRQSLQKLLEIFDTTNLTMSAYLKGLEDCGWLKHIKSVMDTSLFIAKAIMFEKKSVLVHCSDGWDRTAQTCSLAAILLDPYYRTIHGFQTLIEKEWLSFGHKFVHRCGLLAHDPKEISPIFTQYLEAVWQLMNQFPTAFQFNERFLIEINNHVYSCQFGTFLGNSERERKTLKLSQCTYSLWGHMWQNLPDYINPFYSDGAHGMLQPSTAPNRFKFWRSLYNRYNDEVHPRESIADYVCSLNDHNDSLRDHIKYLEKTIAAINTSKNDSSEHSVNIVSDTSNLSVNDKDTNDKEEITETSTAGRNVTVKDSNVDIVEYNTDIARNKVELANSDIKDSSTERTASENDSVISDKEDSSAEVTTSENDSVTSNKEDSSAEVTTSENDSVISDKEDSSAEVTTSENDSVISDKDSVDSSTQPLDSKDDITIPSTDHIDNKQINRSISLPDLSKPIAEFAVEWKSFRDVSQCSCGKPIDVLSRKYHCWNCGEVFCTRCVDLSSALPGHYSGNKVPVCKPCFKQLRK